MATIAALTPTNAGLTPAAFTASTPAGDVIPYTGGDLLIEFDNGHASPITIDVEPVQTTARVPGVGPVDVPTRSLTVAAGALGAFLFKEDQIRAYLENGNLALVYTSGNAALLVRAIKVG